MFASSNRTLSRSIGASCLLHGALIALVLVGWHLVPTPDSFPPSIPVTLVKVQADQPPARTTLSADAPDRAIEQSAPALATLPLAVAPPQSRPWIHPPAAHAAPASPPLPRPTPHNATTLPKLDPATTALLQEGVAGRPLGSERATPSEAAIRSSVAVSDDYLIRLQSRIASFQRYPAAAEAKHIEGKGVVAFSIARDGRLLRVWMDETTGSPELDEASMNMVRAAAPVPALPRAIAGDAVDFFMPIRYGLSNYERLFE